MDRHNQITQSGRPVTHQEAAQANEYFEPFLNATTLKSILGYYRSICDFLHLKPNVFPLFYPKLRTCLNSWRAKALWKKFDARASHKCYGKGKICANTRVLIIGAGPCGLRTAIEAQLLGAKVVVIEKRDRLSRNNVLHLWPFVIEDLRALGAKKFFGKFCAGAIDHISIRQLQCILLKVALLLGVEVHTEVSFENLIEPSASDKIGWRAEFKPADHPVSQYEFDVIIGADGKRNTLQGFKRKEFRGKLAIAITANFINKKTEAEARVEEISGVAFIFNQKFFKDLQEETRIDLENIVYYKDDTHYFVMTAKKASLLEKGVIKQDLADTERLLAPDNVDRDALENYAREAANFSTNYQMPDLEFAVNHYGQPDVAMFDFTSMYAAENASKVLERNGYRLLMILVGDSLLEPFWPTGSGCARGFLSSLDAAWAIRSWSSGTSTGLEVLAERESIYRLLAQTTPDNLNKDCKSYTLDPVTRYPNLNKNVVMPHQTICLFDTDNPKSIERMRRNSTEAILNEQPKKRRRGNVDNEILINWISEQVREHENITVTDLGSIFRDGKILCAIINHYRPDLLDYNAIISNDPAVNNQQAFDIFEKELGIPPIMTGEESVNTEDYLTMASYLTQVYDVFRGEIPHIKHPKLELPETVNRRVDLSFKSFAAIDKKTLPVSQASRPSSRHKRHADAMTHNKQCSMERKIRKRRILEKIDACIGEHDNKLPNQMRGPADEDFAARIKSLEDKWTQPQQVDKKPKDLLRAIGKIETSDWNIKEIEKKIMENKLGKPSTNKDKEKVPKWSKEQFLARQTKMEKQHMERQDSAEAKYADIDKNIKFLDLKLKEGTARDLGQNKVASITEKLTSKVPVPVEPKIEKTNPKPVVLPTQSASEVCHFCNKRVYLMERLSAEGRFFHHGCFKCQYCHTQLRLGSYAFDRDGLYGHKFFCLHHYGMQGEIQRSTKITRKPSQKRDMAKSPDKKLLTGVSGVDLLDRIRTPERIEFSNLSTGHASSDQEESLSQMDEDEWTDKNFGASAAELDDSDDDDSSSSLSDSESDEEDAYDDALEEPATKEGTLKWAERLKNRYRKHSDDYSSSDQSSYYENSSDDDESDTATEGEEEIRARELRKQEVRVEPPIVQTDTGTDTEVVSSETSSESSSEVQNSATEISTDSEFAQDDPTPTRELPIKDFYVTKTRGSSNIPKRIQVTSGYIQKTTNEKAPKSHIELKLHPLVPSSTVAQIPKKPVAPLFPRTEGYALNRTQSTGGIAAKVSLELKKKYLLGEPNHPGNIQKSGSASLLDNKFKSFHTNITDCQKLLKPATEISASMQTFCNKLDERSSPVLSPQSPISKHMPIQEHIENTENTKELPPPDVTNVNDSYVFENECEGRPRSPAHETSIIVPKIDWSKKNKSQSEDSLSESSSSSDNEVPASPNFHFINIPRVEVHTACDDDDLPPDSLCIEENKRIESSAEMHSSINSEQPKSIASEKKSLNQPKSLPTLENVLSDIHNVHIKKDDKNNSPDNEKSLKTSSGRSTPDSNAEQGTAAFTETELSDWARDGNVSDDLEFELNEQQTQEQKKPKEDVKIADISEFEEIGHLCDKLKIKEPQEEQKPANILNSNLDNIEFMDTGTETSSDDGVVDSQNGYVLFKDEDELAEDSLNPNINNIVEATNLHVNEKEPYKNTGYCIIASEENNFGGEVIDLKPSDLEKLKQKQFLTEHEEDSLLIVETGTTTEENTCSDSTVKNVTEIPSTPTVKPLIDNNNSNKQRLEEKLAQVKAELTQNDQKSSQGTILDHSSVDFDEHCQRLQSKVEFGNAKDSIDIRKSRRKSKSEIPQKPDLIQEEKEKYSPMHTVKDITLNLSPTVRTPDIIYKKENIMKERDVNQKLIQEMVMNKMKAENKSLERKKRNRSSSRLSPSHPYDLAKSATTDIVSQINLNNLDKSGRNSTYSTSSSTYATPDVLLTTNSCSPLQNSTSLINVPDISGSSEVFATPQTSIKERNSRPLSVYATFAERKMAEIKSQQENKTSLPDIRKNLAEEFRTPIAPPRQKYDDLTKTAERLKQDARIRARLLSNEELGLSPEDKLQKLREKVAKRGKENEYINSHIQDSIESLVLNTERRNSCLYSNDTLKNKKNSSFRRSKSGDCAINNSNTKLSTCKDTKDSKNVVNIGTKDGAKKIFKSDPNLLNTEQLNVKTPKKSKDRERRKSITKMITTLFTKKSPTGAKGLFSKISPKTKDLSKSCANLDQKSCDILVEEPVRRKSLSEIHVQNISNDDLSPPPIPPLPLNYTGNSIKGTDDSSDGEHDWKKEQSSCDTLDQSGILENSMSSLTGRRSSGKVRKQIRQAQLKRHRMAQEIQRKLEETEVKTRELERRGVQVEKALRGEGSGDCSKEESELLQEWFDLMRDRTELRRYEKELMVRAQELELEDRHARLQQELRERLDTTEKKTDEDIKVEESIISEMMDIVVKRDSLIAVLEEDRLRYSNEDRDLEEQMLAKGLRLTPIRKSTEQ